jgi:hypothetical protein
MTPDTWRIYFHKHEVSKAERQTMLCRVKSWINAEIVGLSDTDYKLTVNGEQYPFDIKLSFLETSKHGYRMKLTSETFGFRPDEEKAHQTLYHTIIAKIRGDKQGFWLKDNDETPIQRKRLLRMKHINTSHKSSIRLHEKSEKTEPFRSADDAQSLRKPDQQTKHPATTTTTTTA